VVDEDVPVYGCELSVGGQHHLRSPATIEPMRRVAIGVVVLALALPVLGGGGPAMAARSGGPGQLHVHTQTIQAPISADPVLFTVPCDPGEQLVSGGYFASSQDAHVVVSYPSDGKGTPTPDGGQPTAWTIGVVNDSKIQPSLSVAAACLAGGDIRSSVASTTRIQQESSFSMAADCPSGTVRAGGGYSSVWNPTSGTAAVTGSYPQPVQQWTIDVALIPINPDVKPQATVTVDAVCVSGTVGVSDLSPTVLDLTAGKTFCSPASQGFVAICLTPWTGEQHVLCPAPAVLSGAGYHVVAGALPGNYSVLTAEPDSEGLWDISISGVSVGTAPISLNLTPVCLVGVATQVTTSPAGGVVTTTSGGGVGTGRTDLTSVALVGGGVLLLLVLVLLAALAMRQVGRRRGATGVVRPPRQPKPAGVGLDAVVRAHRSSYRLDGFRETL
jgi:hypothetical protein